LRIRSTSAAQPAQCRAGVCRALQLVLQEAGGKVRARVVARVISEPLSRRRDVEVGSERVLCRLEGSEIRTNRPIPPASADELDEIAQALQALADAVLRVERRAPHAECLLV